jgi:hypothetical protein
MTSYRRKTVAVTSLAEDFEAKTPDDLRDALDILDKVTRIGVEGYTIVTVKVSGRPEELADLADELNTWTPSGGWSADAQRLFKALRGEDDGKTSW